MRVSFCAFMAGWAVACALSSVCGVVPAVVLALVAFAVLTAVAGLAGSCQKMVRALYTYIIYIYIMFICVCLYVPGVYTNM